MMKIYLDIHLHQLCESHPANSRSYRWWDWRCRRQYFFVAFPESCQTRLWFFFLTLSQLSRVFHRLGRISKHTFSRNKGNWTHLNSTVMQLLFRSEFYETFQMFSFQNVNHIFIQNWILWHISKVFLFRN